MVRDEHLTIGAILICKQYFKLITFCDKPKHFSIVSDIIGKYT